VKIRSSRIRRPCWLVTFKAGVLLLGLAGGGDGLAAGFDPTCSTYACQKQCDVKTKMGLWCFSGLPTDNYGYLALHDEGDEGSQTFDPRFVYEYDYPGNRYRGLPGEERFKAENISDGYQSSLTSDNKIGIASHSYGDVYGRGDGISGVSETRSEFILFAVRVYLNFGLHCVCQRFYDYSGEYSCDCELTYPSLLYKSVGMGTGNESIETCEGGFSDAGLSEESPVATHLCGERYHMAINWFDVKIYSARSRDFDSEFVVEYNELDELEEPTSLKNGPNEQVSEAFVDRYADPNYYLDLFGGSEGYFPVESAVPGRSSRLANSGEYVAAKMEGHFSDKFVLDPDTAETSGVLSSNKSRSIELSVWLPEELLVSEDLYFLRLIDKLSDEPLGLRKLIFREHLELLGSEATDLARMFEDITGEEALELADDRLRAAVFLVTFRLMKQCQIDTKLSVRALQKGLERMPEEWIDGVDELVSRSPDEAQRGGEGGDYRQTDVTKQIMARMFISAACDSLDKLGYAIGRISRRLQSYR